VTTKNELPSITNVRDPRLLADLFHALTQPLTTLRCCLGLSLKGHDVARTRQNIEVALQAAESVSGWIAGIRQLVEDAPPPQNAATSLDEGLRDVIEDLGPVADSMGLTLSHASDPSLLLTIEPPRLRQGLFHLFEFALRSCEPGQHLKIKTATDGDGALLTVVGRAGKACDLDLELQTRLVLGIARHIFEGAGGSLEVRLKSHFGLIVHLPLAGKKPMSNQSSTSRCCA
jgi:hypothetical protein